MVGPNKRKRNDRNYPQDEGRPSPHRPDNLGMAQQPNMQWNEGRGGNHNSNRGRQGGDYRGYRGNHTYHTPTANRYTRSYAQRPDEVAPQSQNQSNDTQSDTQPTSTIAAIDLRPSKRSPSPAPETPDLFEYEFLTQDIIENWADEGKHKFHESVVDLDDELRDGIWIQEIIQAVSYKKISGASAGQQFASVLDARRSRSDEAATTLQDLFTDSIALTPESEWTRTSFAELLHSSGIPEKTWHMVLETVCVEAVGLTRKNWKGKKSKMITNYMYRQSNYNLLREESEGYAKLVTEYFTTAQGASSHDVPPTMALDTFQRVQALVGSFDLDVGRVLDITLDVFANLLVRNYRFFVKLIRGSSWWPHSECPDVIQWRDQGFDTVPAWALPNSTDWGVGEEEVERIANRKPLLQKRDEQFWQAIRDKGMAAYFDLGAKQIVNFDDEAVVTLLSTEVEATGDDKDPRGVEKNKTERMRMNEVRKWMLANKKLPPSGNADAANLLGFKLSFYSSPYRDKSDALPENLMWLSALLIKIGFISLRDLYPHLYPPDNQMSQTKASLEKAQEERENTARSGGGLNKLAMSGALSDDMPPPATTTIKNIKDLITRDSSAKKQSTPEIEAKDELPKATDQKSLLLKNLLSIGALPEAFTILGRFPWLAELDPDLPAQFFRIMHHMLGKLYDLAKPMRDIPDLSRAINQIGESAGLAKGHLRSIAPVVKPLKRWSQIDQADMGEGHGYKLYWDDWTDNVPVCQTVDDLFGMSSTILNYVGVKIGNDASLLVKLIRIGIYSLRQDKSRPNETRWIDLIKRIIMPALSLTSKNPTIANELFSLLRFFPTSTRYSMYAEWHYGPTARLSELKKAFNRTKAEARDVLKRISKTNVKPMGKALAKVAYASPGIVLQTAINQMESYDNLIEVFVECSRYFTSLGYDVLTWCLLSALGGGDRKRIQDDGMLTSSWLKALSTFAGAIYKRYSMCDPLPVLHYVAAELRQGNFTDLELLEQMITAMSGIKSDMAFNDAQVIAMAGGELLQAHTLRQMADERHLNQKSSKRLWKALSTCGLASQLLISISQERQLYTSRELAKNAPLKVLGNNVDKIHSVLIQYLEAFRSNCSIEEFESAIPNPAILIKDYGLDVEIAFMIGRPGITKAIGVIDSIRKAEEQQKRVRAASSIAPENSAEPTQPTDVEMTDAEPSKENAAATIKSDDDTNIVQSIENGEVGEADMDIKEEDEKQLQPETQVDVPSPWHPALTDLIDQIPSIIGKDIASTLSIPFYVSFWSLSLQDILVNTSSYDQELAHQSSLANQLKIERADGPMLTSKERERKVKAISDVKEGLAKEMKNQIGAYTQVRNRLSKEKDHWFSSFTNKVQRLHVSLLQNCFLPRILLGPLDSLYTFTMIKFLHNNGTPGFRTMHLYDQFFKKVLLSSLVFSASAREVENLGRFMNEALKDLGSWHTEKTVYEKNALGSKRQLPGFARKFNEQQGPEEFLEFEPFRHLLFKWHNNINGALKTCFESEEYMHRRNAIIVLKAIYLQFPKVNFMGRDMLAKVSNLSETESRGDLKLAATSLLGNLKPLEKTWIMPQAFHLVNICFHER